MAQRDTYRYHYVQDGRVTHRGITNDLERREGEHQQNLGSGWIKQIGPRVSRDTGLEWERDGGKRI